MGKRARKRGEAPSRTEARTEKAAAALGIAGTLSKPLMDAMNEEAHERFGMGVGVIVQEEDRCRRLLEATEKGWPLTAKRRVWRTAKAAHENWSGKLQAVADAVSAEVPKWQGERPELPHRPISVRPR